MTEYDYELEMNMAEEITMKAASEFLSGDPDWNKDAQVGLICHIVRYDYDFVWLLSRVLFESAVYYRLTGKVM
jgi:hypothetical protein